MNHPWKCVVRVTWPILPWNAALALLRPCVCLFVRPFVPIRYSIKTAKNIVRQRTLHDSTETLVFDTKDLGEIPIGLPPTGHQIEDVLRVTWSRYIFGILYISVTVQDRDMVTTENYFFKRVAFKWHQYQWPWVTLNVTLAVRDLYSSFNSLNIVCITCYMVIHKSESAHGL